MNESQDTLNEVSQNEKDQEKSPSSSTQTTDTASAACTAKPKEGKEPYTVHVAIQAYDYEIERGDSKLPSRRRLLPSRFRDYEYPNSYPDDESDEDYRPDKDHPNTPRHKGRGRPRKILKLEAPQEQNNKTKTDDEEANSQTVSQQEQPENNLVEIALRSSNRTGRKRKYKAFDAEELKVSRPFRCPMTDCGQTFLSSKALARHLVQKHEQSQTEENQPERAEKIYGCAVCRKEFKQLGNLKIHMKRHSGEKNFSCDSCEKKFTSSESLKRHKMSHLGIKPFECDVCQKTFASNVGLKEHKTRHTDSKPYKCDVCHRLFRQVSVYRRHQTTHTDEKRFQCQLCDRKFSQAVYLRSHMKKHTGEKPYKCELCAKSFAHASDKTRHQKTHSSEKPYSCTTCGAHFTDPSSCRRHIKEHSDFQPFTCNECGEMFKRKVSLRTHINRRHSTGRTDLLSQAVTSIKPGITNPVTGTAVQIVEDNKIFVMAPTSEGLMLTESGIKRTTMTSSNPNHDDSKQLITLSDNPDQSLLTVLPNIQGNNSVTGDQGDQLSMETQQILEQISSQLSGEENVVLSGTDGQQVQLAYHVIHDDENQQIVEIQYHSVADAANNVQLSIADDPTKSSAGFYKIEQEDVMALSLPVTNTEVLPQSDVALPSEETPSKDLYLNETAGISDEAASMDSIDISEEQQADEASTLTTDLMEASQLIVKDSSNIEVSQENQFSIIADGSAVSLAKGHEYAQSEKITENISVSQEPAKDTSNSTPQQQFPTVEVGPAISGVGKEGPRTDPQVLGSNPEEFSANISIQLPNVLESEVTLLYVKNPDFTSQEYFNWLSSFTDQCKQTEVPLTENTFKNISQVHKTLSDIMALPKGILAHKDNFRILMNISQDLNAIIQRHLFCVLHTLEEQP